MCSSQAQNAGGEGDHSKRVLLIFSESRDLPGNVIMEQAVRAEMTRGGTNRIEFYTESLDASRFPYPGHMRLFRDYLAGKYAGQPPDLVMLFLAREFRPALELVAGFGTNCPTVFVAVNDLDVPDALPDRPFTGIIQRFDVPGTVKFIFQLQPETRRVVVIVGSSAADAAVLHNIQETARSVDGVAFEYWTNRPLNEIYAAARTLPLDTVFLVCTIQRSVSLQPIFTSQVVQLLAPAANVPVYVLGNGLIGSGAVGGNVVNFEDLGTNAGRLGLRALAANPRARMPVEIKSSGTPMADWRALQRWHINAARLPPNCVIRYRPQSLWQDHWPMFVLLAFGFLAQAVTIAALLVQRKRQQRAEAEILRQRTELAHVSRVSMMGQLASALTHELNQPLGAILRNAEAAGVYLQSAQPDLQEIRAILIDICRDDKRAGNVIDRMRSLFKRQKLTLGALDLQDLVEDTVAMARPDALQRRIKLKVEFPPRLPPARGDRVHVQQVLLNLILNGMDAMDKTPPARRLLTVALEESRHGNLRVSVTDCGAGIAPGDAVRIFEPFFSTKASGMGMGLAISKTIIEAHGGDIWVASCATEGTTFTVLLPPAGDDKIRPGDLPASA